MVVQATMTELKENSSTLCGSHKAVASTTSSSSSSAATVLRGSVHHRLSRNMSVLLAGKRNTKAEFKRLKTIVPSIRKKVNVSKLDIILEAIKYIDDLQDQLINRLGGARSEAALLALSGQEDDRLCSNIDVELSAALASAVASNNSVDSFDEANDDEDDEDLISLSDGYVSDPGVVMVGRYDDDEDIEDFAAASDYELETVESDSSGADSHASVDL